MAKGKNNATAKAATQAKAKKTRGYGHRKLYPYVTKKQAKLAPGMPKFIQSNKAELTDQGNRVLSQPGEMKKTQSKPPLSGPWGRAQSKGTNTRKVTKYIDSNGGSRGRARKILIGAHAVKFGADPKTK